MLTNSRIPFDRSRCELIVQRTGKVSEGVSTKRESTRYENKLLVSVIAHLRSDGVFAGGFLDVSRNLFTSLSLYSSLCPHAVYIIVRRACDRSPRSVPRIGVRRGAQSLFRFRRSAGNVRRNVKYCFVDAHSPSTQMCLVSQTLELRSLLSLSRNAT